MLRMLGVGLATLVAAVMIINATFMLVSPKSWFRLPGWLRTTGTLTEQKYGSGWGAVEVRITGALILALIGWVLFDVAVNHK
jgi:hypothetical protein